jgi:hypothetical protein
MGTKLAFNLLGGTSAEGTPEYERGLGALRAALASDPKDLAIENANLLATNAHLSDQIKRIEIIAEKLSAKVELRDEALCLYSEIVRILEAETIVRPKEVDSLLARIKVLTEQK